MGSITPSGSPLPDKKITPVESDAADPLKEAASAAGRRALSDSTAAAGGAGAAAAPIASMGPGSIEASLIGYTEVLRRLSPEKIKEISAKIHKLEDISASIATLQSKLEHTTWPSDPFFQDKNLPYYALEALRLGKISSLQFGTLMTFFHLLEGVPEVQRKIIPIFDDEGNLNPQVESILSQDSSIFSDRTFLDSFLEEMKKRPKSEQVLLLAEYSLFGSLKREDPAETSIASVIRTAGSDNIFNSYWDLSVGKQYRVIPSIEMMQVFIEELHKRRPIAERPLRMNIVLGESKPREFLEGARKLQRDVCVYFPEAPLPKIADGLKAAHTDFTFHDFYHCLLTSSIPQQQRMLLADFYESLTSSHSEAKEAEVLSEIAVKCLLLAKWNLIDMDFPEYNYNNLLLALKSSAEVEPPFVLLLIELFRAVIRNENLTCNALEISPNDYYIMRLGAFLRTRPEGEQIRDACNILLARISKGENPYELMPVEHRLRQLLLFLSPSES